MRIGMVLLNADYPPDIRVDKEASGLLAAGHRIELACLLRRGGAERARSTERVPEGELEVTRFGPVPAGPRRVANSLAFYADFSFPAYARRLREWARERDVEAFHVHDLLYARTAVRLARELGLPVVVDLHENYPAAIEGWAAPSLPEKVFGTRRRWPAVEIDVARAADRLITVVEEGLDRFRQAGIGDEKLAVVSNTEPLAFGDEVARLSRDPRFGDEIVLAYQGGFAPDRGLESVIRAMPLLLETGSPRPYRLVLAGDGETLPAMKRLADELGVAGSVDFPGWIDMDAVKALVASADVGLVPHLRNRQRETTVPHKLFQYMVSGKAVAVSDCAPLRRIVNGTGCGVVVPGPEPEAWAEALAGLSDREAAAALGRAGRAACEAGLSWETDGARLVAMYDELGGGGNA